MAQTLLASKVAIITGAASASPGLVLTPAARANLPSMLLEIVAGDNLVVDGGTSNHVPGFAQFRQI